jgi:hypothetical protein
MDWNEAKECAENANSEKQIQEIEPRWSWDCGLKLDYDGGLLRVSSRFYQADNNIYNGSVSFLIGDETLFDREFSCRHIDVLKADVETYVAKITANIKLLCENNMAVFFANPEDKR